MPASWLDKVFKTDYTKNDTTISSIFKKHNAAERFNYKDYNTAVTLHDLTPGIAGCFKGQNYGNFSGADGFTSTAPLLCQMEIDGNQVQRDKTKEYQWFIYFAHMNLVISCNDYRQPGTIKLSKQKNVWVLGKNTIKALTDNNDINISKLLGKLAFPAKSDNAKNLRLRSAVWIQNAGSNLNLVNETTDDEM